MHVQRSGFRVIVVMQAVARNALSEGCSWSIVSRITSDWIYDASGADAGSMNRIALGMTLNAKVFEETGSPSRFT
ncbi:MAG: hypothetical protein HN985_13665 [Planctomycetaceae bacterium]|nr:hypothetical protein [Planctomycetaceae bacterium]